ncbi:MAG: dipicolinate synthase subunit B [Clostridia bacterium]|nr:dipicolinate synthase subunit B [Clostridia bacterium]MBR2973491.1 dipicolinate synthase subunit B [Clostridia bacterium]MBR3576045.1 dipicolinate synthase subunit B [Clostridia bacterium]
MNLEGLTVGFAVTGSFCTLETAIKQISQLKAAGANVVPIMSEIVKKTDTRFGSAEHFKSEMEELSGNSVICTIKDAEPIGPKKLLDALVIAPCTGNTISKLANGINDTCVTMAAKAHLRNLKPLVVAVSTNDALGASARNIGQLLLAKNIFFVPYGQDDPVKKPNSMIADFSLIVPATIAAVEGKQLQPIII